MPLRDHFGKTSVYLNWEALHGHWPSKIVDALNAVMPDGFVAQPKIHLGSRMEIDVVGLEDSERTFSPTIKADGPSQVSLAAPTLLLETDDATPAEYEIEVFDENNHFKLVAAIEIVSPSNKDRPEHRHQFVEKCATLLDANVCVIVVDPVTVRTANLYGKLQEFLESAQTPVGAADLYAVSCRNHRQDKRRRLEAWEFELRVGGTLPTLPLWLSDSDHVLLDLEATYESACRSLRIR